MKDQILKTSMWMMAAAMLIFSSCKKEKFEPMTQNATDQTVSMDVIAIADQVDANYLAIDLRGGDETDAFYAMNEGLIEEYLLDAESFDATGKAVPAQLIRCLKSVDLSDEQIAKIRRALGAYADCKATSIKKHRAAYADLKSKIEAARKDLIKKYRNDDITKEEFHKGMKNLREKFHNGMKHIKQSYAKSLRACFEKFVGHLKDILTDRQWKAFMTCVKK